MLSRDADPCGTSAQLAALPPAQSASRTEEHVVGSQDSSRGPVGRLDFSQWTLVHYMRRPEPERAFFWQHAPAEVRASLADEIRELPEGHVTRRQADERGWVVEVL